MAGRIVPVAEAPPAVSVCAAQSLRILSKRADFLRAAQARRSSQPGLLLQARDRSDGDPTIGIGFTCSKKVGNAVARNRAKRRLREIAQIVLQQEGRAGHDYVLVGRKDATAARPFTQLIDDLRRALTKVH